MRIISRLFLLLLAVMGLGLAIGGGWLLSLGGSPYYLIAGLAWLLAAWLLWRRRRSGALVTAAVAVLTVPWALWESGADFWALFPRLMAPLAVAALALWLVPVGPSLARPRRWRWGGTVFALLFAIGFGMAFMPHGEIKVGTEQAYKLPSGNNEPVNWSAYGRTNAGLRDAPFNQINRDNVSQLKLAWSYRTGDVKPGVDQNTPLQIGDTVYSCTRNDKIIALDADTGQPRWTFDPEAKSPFWQRCRGLGYYRADAPAAAPAGAASSVSTASAQAAAAPEGGVCRDRIVQTTIDARLIELDARTGKLCEDFGNKGIVALSENMGPVKPGFYFQTSAPLVARDLIVIGGWVVDNQMRGEPSGVIRAFSARTGELVWAWDLGNPAITRLPPEGESYTRGTPNMWTTAAYDDKLGLIYAPLGNATPDYYGPGRPEHSEEYASSLVALDVATGRPRWKFQTVHHDIWDYDLPSQPALIDLPDGQGGSTPAVLQTTKRGQLFLLNRATGKPLADVAEQPVTQNGAVPEQKLSPTQPYSVGMPTIGVERLTEHRMWGATMFDQLMCRIEFRQMRYDGDFTPPGLVRAIEHPGNVGGLNWGSVSVDTANQRVFLNDIRVPSVFQLVPRDEYPEFAKKYPTVSDGHGPSAQLGTPYGMYTNIWFSKIGVPCVQPPFGTLTAIDLKTRKIAWQVPAGTAEQLGPLGVKMGLPMPIGMPSYAGTLATQGGLVFFAGTQDFYLRAYDAETGKEVWKAPLPVGSSATPMTYVSPKTGKQYVVISAGGAAYSKQIGDYVLAFALP